METQEIKKPLTLFQKIHSIQTTIRAMKKDGDGFNYEYLKGDTLLSIIRPQMDKLGLLLFPEVLDVTDNIITYDSYNKKAGKVVSSTENHCRVKMIMHWVDVESNERYDVQWAAEGMNAFDKSFGSALTYGERYYLLKTFHIATDKDDVDAISKERDEKIALAQEAKANAPVKKPFIRGSKAWEKAVERMRNGEDMSQLDNYFIMTEETWNQLQEDVNKQ